MLKYSDWKILEAAKIDSTAHWGELMEFIDHKFMIRENFEYIYPYLEEFSDSIDSEIKLHINNPPSAILYVRYNKSGRNLSDRIDFNLEYSGVNSGIFKTEFNKLNSFLSDKIQFSKSVFVNYVFWVEIPRIELYESVFNHLKDLSSIMEDMGFNLYYGLSEKWRLQYLDSIWNVQTKIENIIVPRYHIDEGDLRHSLLIRIVSNQENSKDISPKVQEEYPKIMISELGEYMKKWSISGDDLIKLIEKENL
jgi:hypothetical protein